MLCIIRATMHITMASTSLAMNKRQLGQASTGVEGLVNRVYIEYKRMHGVYNLLVDAVAFVSLPYRWNLHVLSAVHARAYLPCIYEYVRSYIYCAAYRNWFYTNV